MLSQFRPAVALFALLTLITGIVYPLFVTAIATVAFPERARGSIIRVGDEAVGSIQIAQPFTAPEYFWPRPSAAGYDGMGGSGSNLAPTNPSLAEVGRARVEVLDASGQGSAVPVDLVTASASGLDPHISPAAAEFQVARVAAARRLPANVVRILVSECTEGRTLGVLGEPRVNVLQLNLRLDNKIHPGTSDRFRAVVGWRGKAFSSGSH